MTRLARIPALALIALVAIAVGGVLPFSPVAMAAAVPMPAEEEKNPAEPSEEIKFAQASPAGPNRVAARPPDRQRSHPTPLTSLGRSVASVTPAVALNNGLSAYYRC